MARRNDPVDAVLDIIKIILIIIVGYIVIRALLGAV